MDIKLNFINQSNDLNNSQIVIFQKNIGTNIDTVPVAWKVISDPVKDQAYPFTFPLNYTVSASDNSGNTTPHKTAVNGMHFNVASTESEALSAQVQKIHEDQIIVANTLPLGPINAVIFHDNRLLAIKNEIAPQQEVKMQFMPTIWIGLVSGVKEGEVLNSTIANSINTQISLLGIATADIVLTGSGPDSYLFSLENVRYA